jgi:hypothetical protein
MVVGQQKRIGGTIFQYNNNIIKTFFTSKLRKARYETQQKQFSNISTKILQLIERRF